MTNGDRIRAMNNEELAEKISMCMGGCNFCIYNEVIPSVYCKKYYCKAGIKAYLDSEVE